jgi:hypothetical protein
MVAAPAFTPVIIPVELFTVATIVLLLLHIPPVTASKNVVEASIQITEAALRIAEGKGLTVTIVVAVHPVGPAV